MKALVLGAGGNLGSELVRQLSDAVGLTHQQLSVTDLRALEAALPLHAPDVVINCAAFDAVDGAESQQDAAYQVNAQGAFNVALACARHGVRMIHFSTNYVFDGSLDRPYTEADAPGPLSVYGKSKLEGEKLVSMVLPAALVIRTSALYARHEDGAHRGFPDRIVDRAQQGDAIRVVSDQLVNPTFVPELAAATVQLAAGELTGLVHVVGGGCCSWHELAVAAVAACGVEAPVQAIPSAELGAPAARPLNGCLVSGLAPPLRPWRESLKEWAALRSARRLKNP